MKALVFDSGSIISLAMNDLLWILRPLKALFDGEFFISPAVKYELVERPLKGKKYKFEAVMVNETISSGDLKISKEIYVTKLLDLVNHIYIVKGKPLEILHKAEIEALALAISINASAYVVDERTARMIIENPMKLKDLYERKLHSKVNIDVKKLNEFKKVVKGMKVLRSSELVLIAYEHGLFDRYLSDEVSKEDLVDGLLWGLKLRGCAISGKEIDEFKGLVKS